MIDVKIVQETCCTEGCGIMFWIAEEYQQRLVSTKRSFYCPNGHSMSYQGESDKTKIIRLQNEKAQIIREKDLEIAHIKKSLTKKRKPRKAK